jgi:hypothetical protein
MTKGMNDIAAVIATVALVVAGLTVGAQTSSHAESRYAVGGAGVTIMPSSHSTRPASESFAPAAKAAPLCGFAATGSC